MNLVLQSTYRAFVLKEFFRVVFVWLKQLWVTLGRGRGYVCVNLQGESTPESLTGVYWWMFGLSGFQPQTELAVSELTWALLWAFGLRKADYFLPGYITMVPYAEHLTWGQYYREGSTNPGSLWGSVKPVKETLRVSLTRLRLDIDTDSCLNTDQGIDW